MRRRGRLPTGYLINDDRARINVEFERGERAGESERVARREREKEEMGLPEATFH